MWLNKNLQIGGGYLGKPLMNSIAKGLKMSKVWRAGVSRHARGVKRPISFWRIE
jgi:hypothetical protein